MTPENLETLRNGNRLDHLTKLVSRLEEVKAEIKNKEEEVKRLTTERERLEKLDIPDYMLELGLDSALLTSGLSVIVQPFYYARLPSLDDIKPESVSRRENALKWLRDHNHGGIIKENIVVIPSLANAQLVLDFLKEIQASYEEKSSVHWKTLESWFKEVVSSGQSVPMDLFSGYVGRLAKVK